MLLDRDEKTLYIAIANADTVEAVNLKTGIELPYVVSLDGAGSVPLGLALSSDGKFLFAASASVDAIAVLGVKPVPDLSAYPNEHMVFAEGPPLGFIPTEWYPSALAIAGNDLLIATAKGEGSGPNNMQGTLKGERKRKEHPYIPTLIGGSIQRLSLADIDKNLAAYTRQVEEDNLFHSDGGKFDIRRWNESHPPRDLRSQRKSHLRSDLRRPAGWRRRPIADHVRQRHHAKRAQTRAAVRRARQFLRQRRSFRRRPSLVHRRHHQRLQRENLADRLSRQRTHLRFRRHRGR